MDAALDQLPDDPAALKAIIVEQRALRKRMSACVRACEALVEALKLRIARLRRQEFGRSTEKIAREMTQLEVKIAAEDTHPEAGESDAGELTPARAAPRRRGEPRISGDAPRERIVLDPGQTCPECGGPLRLLGEDVSGILEDGAAKLKIVEAVRPEKSCRRCETIAQVPAPSRPIPRGMAGPGLLAHILVARVDDRLPLDRQGEIFARLGADIPRSTLIDWCGQAVGALGPLVAKIRESVLSTDRLHADDTPIRVLDRQAKVAGRERGVREGRILTHVRDDRPWCGDDPPGVACFFSADRRGEHPRKHLERVAGILQADACAGFKALYEPGPDGIRRVREAACWAHLRRDVHDVWKSDGSEIAREALERIGDLCCIERRIAGLSAEQRLEIRDSESRPRVEAFHAWLTGQLVRLPGKGDLAKAMRYALGRWPSFTPFPENGRVALDNNPAERAVKPVVIGRKTWMFAGSNAGGETLADAMTIIETARMSGLNPKA